MEVVFVVKQLLEFPSSPLQLRDFCFQPSDQPLRPHFCRCLLTLDHLDQLGSTSLEAADQSGEDLPTFLNVPFCVLLRVSDKNRKSGWNVGIFVNWSSNLSSTLYEITLLHPTNSLNSSRINSLCLAQDCVWSPPASAACPGSSAELPLESL